MSASTGLYFSPDLQALHRLGHLSPWVSGSCSLDLEEAGPHPLGAHWGMGETMAMAQRPSFWSGRWSHPSCRGTQVPLSGLCVYAKSLSRVQLSVTPRTVACQAPLPVGFSRRESWSGFPFPSPLWTLALLHIIKFFSFSPFLVTETWSLSPVETSAEFLIQHLHSEFLPFCGGDKISQSKVGTIFLKNSYLFIDHAGSSLLLADFL